MFIKIDGIEPQFKVYKMSEKSRGKCTLVKQRDLCKSE